MRIQGFEQSQLNNISKSATEVFRTLAEQQLEILSGNISLVSDQIKRLSNAKNPTDFLTTQKECLAEGVNTTVKNMQKVLNTSLESMQQLTKSNKSTGQTTIKMKTKKTKKRTK